jgi:hypothetical protein
MKYCLNCCIKSHVYTTINKRTVLHTQNTITSLVSVPTFSVYFLFGPTYRISTLTYCNWSKWQVIFTFSLPWK